MTKTNYYVSAERNFDVYYDFSSGLNTVASNENLSDNELVDMTNYDIVERGSLAKRYGMVKHRDTIAGFGQGHFRYYRDDSTFDEILAVNGKLQVNYAFVDIQGLPGGFQTTKKIEAVQFQNKLFIATGTKLLEYDGTTVKVVEAFVPKPLDVLYIGTNALADKPDEYLKDGEALTFRVDGVTFTKRYGIVNEPVTLTAYHSIPAGKQVEYQFEFRSTFMEEGKWNTGQDWSDSKTYVFNSSTGGDFQFRVNQREKGKTVPSAQYIVPLFKVKPTADPNDVPVDSSFIHTCNNIRLHWNRLIMFGDSKQPDAIYISELNNPRYFPTPNSLRFENGKNEKITTLLRFRDMLVAFTPTTIQALFGKSPYDFKRFTINTSVGCIAPETAAVMENAIIFLSQEGLYALTSVGTVEEQANVQRLDVNVSNLVYKDTNACAAVHQNQYHLVYPNRNIRLRYYLHMGAWMKDESVKMDFSSMKVFDGQLYGQSKNTGAIMRFDSSTYSDDGVLYENVIETKSFNSGRPFHKKKLKEIHMVTSPKGGDILGTLSVYADSENILNPEQSYARVNEQGEVEWVQGTEDNFTAVNYKVGAGTVTGQWKLGENPFGLVDHTITTMPISGQGYSVKMKFVHKQDIPMLFLGVAFVFKVKRP